MHDTNDYYVKQKEESSLSGARKVLYRPLSFFLIIVAIIIIMSIFLKANVIEVEGNTLYTDEEIIAASGINKGDNLFFINRIACGSRLVTKLPYVDEVSITRQLPNKITITIKESSALAYLEVDGEYWTLGSDGKLLGAVSNDDNAKVAKIIGLKLGNVPAAGDYIAPVDGEEEKAAYLIEILQQIKGRKLTGEIGVIDMTDAKNPSFEYLNRFTVKLGPKDDTEYKFGKLISAVGQLGANDTGILDLSMGDTVTYNPN